MERIVIIMPKYIKIIAISIILAISATQCGNSPKIPEARKDMVPVILVQETAAAKTDDQVGKILNTARKHFGSNDYNGYCQRFVRICYESAGIYADRDALSALEAWGMWGISTRRDNIPVGACVYFQGYGYSWEYGHVAIYTGNDYIIDATFTHGICERKLTNWTGYLGWGYQAGVKPSWGRIPGDVDGDGTITANDARLALLAAAKQYELNEAEFEGANVLNGTVITAAAARQILLMAAKLR